MRPTLRSVSSRDANATGLIVGRFCPPHLGHDHLIDRAAAAVDRLVVFVNTRDDEPVPGELRAAWLQELHPNVRVVEIRHALATNFGDEELWARWMSLFRAHWPYPQGPDVVFSSEAYGSSLAARFGAREVVVDAERATVPISATIIRERPLEHLDYLAPPVRAWIEGWARQRPADA
jgi:HTH-type transcriptional regulator, transcriptional repressor of NAD biosynthesis genes